MNFCLLLSLFSLVAFCAGLPASAQNMADGFPVRFPETAALPARFPPDQGEQILSLILLSFFKN